MITSTYNKNEAINYCFLQSSCNECKYKAHNGSCKLLLNKEVKQ